MIQIPNCVNCEVHLFCELQGFINTEEMKNICFCHPTMNCLEYFKHQKVKNKLLVSTSLYVSICLTPCSLELDCWRHLYEEMDWSLREMTNIWKYSGFMGGKCKVLLDLNAHVYFGFFCEHRFIWK